MANNISTLYNNRFFGDIVILVSRNYVADMGHVPGGHGCRLGRRVFMGPRTTAEECGRYAILSPWSEPVLHDSDKP